jgi:hypothetical protein
MIDGVSPADWFAEEFLRFVLHQHDADRAPLVKILYASNFVEAMPHLSKYARRSKGEYADDPIAAEGYAAANAYTMTMIGESEEKKREAFLAMGFQEERASVLAKHDAVIFLNQQKIAGYKRELGQQEANELVTKVIAHECTHVVEHMLGKKIIVDFDYKHSFEHPAVERLLADFKRNIDTELQTRYGNFV